MEYKFSDKVSKLQASAIREILKFTSDPEVISFAAGNPAPEAFPKKEIADISAELLRDDPILSSILSQKAIPLSVISSKAG